MSNATTHTRGPWLTRDEAAKYVGISTRTIIRWENIGLPAYWVNGRPYYTREEIDQFIEKGRRVRGFKVPM